MMGSTSGMGPVIPPGAESQLLSLLTVLAEPEKYAKRFAELKKLEASLADQREALKAERESIDAEVERRVAERNAQLDERERALNTRERRLREIFDN